MSNNRQLFAFLTGFYCLLFFVFNIKSYIIVFLLAFSIFFLYFKYSLIESAFIIFIVSLPFENSLREWVFQVTNPLFTGTPTSGYTYYFGLSLKLIFGIFLFILLTKKKYFSNDYSTVDIVLISFFAVACINTLFFFSTLSVLGLIRLWLSILFYFSAKIFFKSQPHLFPIFISAIFIFSVAIGINQLVYQRPIGKFIELTPSFNVDGGYSTTDGPAQYRVSGFISHPVYFGSFMSILLPIFIVFGLATHLPSTTPIALIGVVIMLGTNSRSLWLTLPLSFFLLLPYIKQKYKLVMDYKSKIMIAVFILSSIFIVISRLQSITTLFSQNGNGSVRLELIWQSLIMLSQHPLGVGLNQFTIQLINMPLPSGLSGFIVPVHNTFLIIITELGIVAGSLFIYFVAKSMFFKKPDFNYNPIAFGAFVGAVTFLVNSQFHPLLNLDPTFDLFMLTLGYISSQYHIIKT